MCSRIIRFTKVEMPTYPRIKRFKAVTIGIGFRCTDGVVILSDTQISNGTMKYYEGKIHPISLKGSEGLCGVVLTYSGSPALWKKFRDKFDSTMRDAQYDPTPTSIEQSISELLGQMANSLYDPSGNPDLYLLCGMVCEGQEAILLKSQAETVHRVIDGFDAVGAGDSSVIRFLSKALALRHSALSKSIAKKIGTYVLLQAKHYIDGCGGDTDIYAVAEHGGIEDSSELSFIYENNVGMAEDAFRSLYIAVVKEDEASLPEAMARLIRNLKDARGY